MRGEAMSEDKPRAPMNPVVKVSIFIAVMLVALSLLSVAILRW